MSRTETVALVGVTLPDQTPLRNGEAVWPQSDIQPAESTKPQVQMKRVVRGKFTGRNVFVTDSDASFKTVCGSGRGMLATRPRTSLQSFVSF